VAPQVDVAADGQAKLCIAMQKKYWPCHNRIYQTKLAVLYGCSSPSLNYKSTYVIAQIASMFNDETHDEFSGLNRGSVSDP
jgi:hypothetical protein